MTTLYNLYKQSTAGKSLVSEIEADSYASRFKTFELVKRVRVYGDQYVYLRTSESYDHTTGILTIDIVLTDLNNNEICSESHEETLNTPEIEGE